MVEQVVFSTTVCIVSVKVYKPKSVCVCVCRLYSSVSYDHNTLYQIITDWKAPKPRPQRSRKRKAEEADDHLTKQNNNDLPFTETKKQVCGALKDINDKKRSLARDML